MIVVLQSLQVALGAIRRQIGNRDNVRYTDDHRQALAIIKEIAATRIVVIMSDHYLGEDVTGSTLAQDFKTERPNAWCLLYTSERPNPGPSVDGVINKLSNSLPKDAIRLLVDAGIDDPGKFPNLESLYEAFPWIQRPVR